MKPVIQHSEFRIQKWRVAGARLVAAVAVLVAASSCAIAASGEQASAKAVETHARRSPGEVGFLDAAERGDRTIALQLLAKGANPNSLGPDGTTAVMWAA